MSSWYTVMRTVKKQLYSNNNIIRNFVYYIHDVDITNY